MTQDLHVIVVDDEPSVVETLALLLRANGFPVEGFTAHPRPRARIALRAQQPLT
jgi:FixJ family two-component response regulator